MQTKFILKVNTHQKIDLPKLTTLESTKTTVVKTVNSSHKVNKDKINSHEIKPKKKTTPPPKKVALDFQDIYNNLHNNFPDVINMDHPLILSIGIHKDIAKELGISNRYIHKWLSWYTRKSKYYNNHKEGLARLNLKGIQSGVVTEQEARNVSSKTDKWLKKKEDRQDIKL